MFSNSFCAKDGIAGIVLCLSSVSQICVFHTLLCCLVSGVFSFCGHSLRVCYADSRHLMVMLGSVPLCVSWCFVATDGGWPLGSRTVVVSSIVVGAEEGFCVVLLLLACFLVFGGHRSHFGCSVIPSFESVFGPHFSASMFGSVSGVHTGFVQHVEGGESSKQRMGGDSSCLAVTVRCIEKSIAECASASSELRIYGQEFGTLILVGFVENVREQPGSVEFVLHDASGCLAARYFVMDDSARTVAAGIKSGTYVHVFGNVRTAPMKHFAVQGIRPVVSADEVSYHMIQVAYTYLCFCNGQCEAVMPAPSTPSAHANLALPSTAVFSPPKSAAAEADMHAPPAGQALKTAVAVFLENSSAGRGEAGVPVSDICKNLSFNTEEQVRDMLGQLLEEGVVYTTVDEEHYCFL